MKKTFAKSLAKGVLKCYNQKVKKLIKTKCFKGVVNE